MRVRGLLENSAFAFAGDLFIKGSTALVTVVAARVLTLSQFALFAAALAAAGVLSAFFDMGAQMLITRDGVESPHTRAALFHALLRGRLLLVLAVFAASAIAGIIFDQVPLLLLTVLLGTLGAVQMLLTGALRSAQNLFPEALLKFVTAALTLFACGVCAIAFPSALAFLAGLTVALALVLLPMAQITRRVFTQGHAISAWSAARRSLPLGAFALGVLAYYRSGTLLLKVLSTPTQTAHFAAASTIAFALLMAPNAITTGLLPKLAASNVHERAALVRRATLWALVMCTLIAAAVTIFAHPLLVLMFGARYGYAAGTLRLLAISTALIGPTGTLGLVLISEGKVRMLGIQVGASLLLNIIILCILAPKLGATGAGIATLSCETLALVMIVVASVRAMPDLLAHHSFRHTETKHTEIKAIP